MKKFSKGTSKSSEKTIKLKQTKPVNTLDNNNYKIFTTPNFTVNPMKGCVITTVNQDLKMFGQDSSYSNNVKINSYFSKSPKNERSSIDLTKSVFKNDYIPIRVSSKFENNTDTLTYFNEDDLASDEEEKDGKLAEEEYIYSNQIKIIKLIDQGAQAKIYLGEIIEFKTAVAVKRYNVKNFEQAILENIIRETEIVKNLDHENIIKYYALECSLIEKNNGNIDIIMEYVEGCNLKEFVKAKSRLNIKTTKDLTKKILNGIRFLHENRIIHRDLKPENIMISHDLKKIKITDFGISTKVKENDSLQNRTLTGTAWYMAPEIILNKPYGYEVDIWSLGCIVYEMVSGQKPFSDANQFNAMIKATQYNSPLQYASDEIKDIFYEKSNRCLLDFVECCWRTNNICRPSAKELLEHKFLIN